MGEDGKSIAVLVGMMMGMIDETKRLKKTEVLRLRQWKIVICVEELD